MTKRGDTQFKEGKPTLTAKTEKKQLLRNNEYYNTQNVYDELYFKSKNGESFYNLMDLITSPDNIGLAYRNIKNNNGSNTPGTDKKTIQDLKGKSKEEIILITQKKLKNYNPKTVRRVEIPKPNGKTRPLGIPCIDDRLIQQCIKQVLEPICEAKFHKHSYGFRPNRSTHHAIARAQCLVNITGLHYCVDIDIKGFFDNIKHSKLIKQLWTMGIKDKTLIKILKKILTSEIEHVGIPNKGTPQGGIISPLLSNIVLNELDWWISDQWETIVTKHDYVKKNGKGKYNTGNKNKALKKTKLKEVYIVRYADDFKLFCRDHKTAKKVYKAVEMWLKERLDLEISNEKSKITNLRNQKTEFLGFNLWAGKKGKRIVCYSNMTDKAKNKTKDNIKKQIKIAQKERTVKQANNLNAIILGIHNYYQIATHICRDMAEIAFKVNTTFDNRLKQGSKGTIYRSVIYEKRYSEYSNKNRNIAGIAIFPIHGCKTKHAINFTQEINNYTEQGRKLIHKKVIIAPKIIEHILANSWRDSIELADNKLSLVYGQLGLCGITRTRLEINEFDCHHKIPKKLGGTDDYSNLILVDRIIHKLIHATDKNIIDKYKNIITDKYKADLNIKSLLRRINTFRVKAGVSKIDIT